MLKKRIVAVAVIALAAISSTSLVGFASRKIASNAKGALKVVAENNNTSAKVTKSKLLDISDDQAIQMAKDGIRYYGDVDPDKIISEYGMTATIQRNSANYSGGLPSTGFGVIHPSIDVMFYNEQKMPCSMDVRILTETGKIYVVNVQTPDRFFKNAPVDYNKVKEATLKFIKDKGFGTNYESMALGGDMASEGISGSVTQYADGTEVLLEFDNKNYSLFNLTVYNLKTDHAKPIDRTYYPVTVK